MWLRELLGLPEPPEPTSTTVLREALTESWDARQDAERELRAWDHEREILLAGKARDRADVARVLRRARAARDGQ